MGEYRASIDDEKQLEAYADRLWESVETHQLSDSAVAALSDLVVDCTSTGIILRANLAFCEFTGLDASQIEGRDGHEFAFLQNRETPRCTVELTALNGDQTWFDRLQISMRDAHSGNYFIRIIGRDVTEHKRSELALIEARKRAEDADIAKSRFVAMVSHEIRTPLNGIIGMGKLMSDTNLSPEQQNYIEAITSSSEALLVLVNDLLQFGRNQLAQNKLCNEPTDVRGLVVGVVELLAEKAHSKDLELAYLIEPDVPEVLSVDAGRLRQMLFNVVGNGVKFTEIGGIRIDVHHAASTLNIDVKDTGPGISVADSQRIFKPFQQLEDPLRRTHDGAGLGLAISKQMAELMGGDIVVQSAEGGGSSFHISVDAEEIRAAKGTDINLTGQRFAMIVRDGVEADVLCELIATCGGAAEVVSMIDFIESEPNSFDTIIFDHRLGDVDNILDTIANRNIRKIGLISPDERGSIGAKLQTDGHAFLTRPIRQSTLMRVVAGPLESNFTEAAPVSHKKERQQPDALNVLLAEDNAINALLASRLLEKNGCNVTLVQNGHDAVAAAETQQFDIILMDYHMPIMDGLEAIKLIRKAEDGIVDKRTPIFMITADSGEDVHQQVMNAGASGLLEKPLSQDAFYRAVSGTRSQVA